MSLARKLGKLLDPLIRNGTPFVLLALLALHVLAMVRPAQGLLLVGSGLGLLVALCLVLGLAFGADRVLGWPFCFDSGVTAYVRRDVLQRAFLVALVGVAVALVLWLVRWDLSYGWLALAEAGQAAGVASLTRVVRAVAGPVPGMDYL